MKCPHCGMNIRDETTECGYCGGKIVRRPETTGSTGRYAATGGSTAPPGATRPQKQADESGKNDDEEEGGLAAILQPGEQVLIGSLNVSVKKFFFHAYLTDRRIFLIDTQEKKLRVTAKDVARDTIAGSIVEFSENSDPVLVLSIRSGDEEIKTMKLVFVQGGMDRSAEIDEWIALLHEEELPKKSSRRPALKPEEPPDTEDEKQAVVPPREKPREKQELHPAKKPLKDHERQPPVKRLLSLYKVPVEEPGQEPEPEPRTAAPPRRTQVRQVEEPVRRQIVKSSYDQEAAPTRESDLPPVRKPEVQSAMKIAMKGAMNPTGQQQPVKKAVVEPQKRFFPEVEPEPEFVPPHRPVVQESVQDKPAYEELADTPQFCHNCGKKLPHSANFCPGCGTKLNQGRTLPHTRTPPAQPGRKTTRTDPRDMNTGRSRKMPKRMSSKRINQSRHDPLSRKHQKAAR